MPNAVKIWRSAAIFANPADLLPAASILHKGMLPCVNNTVGSTRRNRIQATVARRVAPRSAASDRQMHIRQTRHQRGGQGNYQVECEMRGPVGQSNQPGSTRTEDRPRPSHIGAM